MASQKKWWALNVTLDAVSKPVQSDLLRADAEKLDRSDLLNAALAQFSRKNLPYFSKKNTVWRLVKWDGQVDDSRVHFMKLCKEHGREELHVPRDGTSRIMRELSYTAEFIIDVVAQIILLESVSIVSSNPKSAATVLQGLFDVALKEMKQDSFYCVRVTPRTQAPQFMKWWSEVSQNGGLSSITIHYHGDNHPDINRDVSEMKKRMRELTQNILGGDAGTMTVVNPEPSDSLMEELAVANERDSIEVSAKSKQSIPGIPERWSNSSATPYKVEISDREGLVTVESVHEALEMVGYGKGDDVPAN